MPMVGTSATGSGSVERNCRIAETVCKTGNEFSGVDILLVAICGRVDREIELACQGLST